VPEVSDHSREIDGLPVFWRSAPAPAGREQAAPALYLHGVPTSSDDWVKPREHHGRRPAWKRWWRREREQDRWTVPPLYASGFLERSGGLAPDLPGFGRSGKPGNRRYTIAEYDRFIERFLDELEVERVSLLVHDWGSVGLAFAQRLPERVERLAIVNAVPFLPGYRWHRAARIWRTPGLGELAMGATGRGVLRAISMESNATPGPMPEAWMDSVLEHFDPGTQRAILRLYRSSPPEVLQASGLDLGRLTMPALVAWGLKDPYIPASFARGYAQALPNAELLELPDAGHWPWLDRPDLVERLVDFLSVR
jgi:pimeloyl-ACP methyl ester carboxylesterase